MIHSDEELQSETSVFISSVHEVQDEILWGGENVSLSPAVSTALDWGEHV